MCPLPENPRTGDPDEPDPTLPAEAWLDSETTLRRRTPEDSQDPVEWVLVVYAGMQLGRVFSLQPGDNLVGRSPQCQIPLLDEEVSRNHCRVRVVPGHPQVTLEVEDLGSTNGTFLNGQNIAGIHPLRAGDRLECGNHVLKVVAMDALERAFHQTLLDQSTRDPLTGLANRLTILSEFQSRFDLSMRHGRPLSIIMIDLDHFKQVNDTHGHGAGDLTLQIFGELVRDRLRSTDLAGRIGGEEFLLVLPETDRVGALMLAERIRTVIQTTPIPLPTDMLNVTASLGLAERDDRDRDAGALMGRADAALYRAKRDGRNRTLEASRPR